MDDYQERAIQERTELVRKIVSLEMFIERDDVIHLPFDKALLFEQALQMRAYCNTLDYRIGRFPQGQAT